MSSSDCPDTTGPMGEDEDAPVFVSTSSVDAAGWEYGRRHYLDGFGAWRNTHVDQTLYGC